MPRRFTLWSDVPVAAVLVHKESKANELGQIGHATTAPSKHRAGPMLRDEVWATIAKPEVVSGCGPYPTAGP
jgi:hypothetical protein